MLVPSKMPVLTLRILTAVVLLAVIVPAITIAPGWLWLLFCIAAAIACSIEWSGLSGAKGLYKVLVPCVTGGAVAIFICFPYYARWIYWPAMLIWILVSTIVISQRTSDLNSVLKVLAGMIVIIAAIVALSALRSASPLSLIALMAIVWISDTSAYAFGKAFGRSKLAPRISPGKTWEGVAGAIFAVCIYGGILRFIFPAVLEPLDGIRDQSDAAFFATWVALAIAGVLGDLGESWAKRVAGVKDSGKMLPGHGGALDRVDALLPVLPLAALIYL